MTVLRDALANLDPAVQPSTTYAKGVLVGVVAGIMHARKCDFERAIVEVSRHLPRRVEFDAIPEGWEEVTGRWVTTKPTGAADKVLNRNAVTERPTT